MKVDVTHKGWFGICPVYFGGIETDAPLVLERHWLLMPLLAVSEFFFFLCFVAIELMGHEPQGWPLKITGKLDAPRTITLPEDRP